VELRNNSSQEVSKTEARQVQFGPHGSLSAAPGRS
jgi:hypothetical protein